MATRHRQVVSETQASLQHENTNVHIHPHDTIGSRDRLPEAPDW
jgi:hypothetical protein